MFGFAKSTATPGPRVIFSVPSLVRCRVYTPVDSRMFDRIIAFDNRYLPTELSTSYPELFDPKTRTKLRDPILEHEVDCTLAMASSDPEVFFEGLKDGEDQFGPLINGALARNCSLDRALIGQPATLVCRPIRYSLSDAENLDNKLHKTVFLALLAIKVDIRSLGFNDFDTFLRTEENEFEDFTDKGGDL